MSKRKRGVSADEKRERMIKLLMDEKSVFHLKELEKLGPKVGVIAMAVKDVIQQLVDDSLIETDKIGTSNFFWAFPSKLLCLQRNRIEAAQQTIDTENKAIERLQEEVEKLQSMITAGDERMEKLNRVEEFEEEKKKLEEELEIAADNDPELLRLLGERIAQSKECVERWTDNVFQVKKYFTSKFNMDPTQLDKMMGVPSDFDYLE